MDANNKTELLNQYKNKNYEALNKLVEYYYNHIGIKWINKYPRKANREKIAKELIIKAIDRYVELDLFKTSLNGYICKQFERKYQDFELGDEIEGNKNKKRKLKRKVLKAANNNEEEYNKLYEQYYYIIEKYLKLYPNKENKEQCANALFKKILERFIKEDEYHLALYIKNYFSKNYEKYQIGDELKELTEKVPVSDLIEQAKSDLEARNKLVIKYMYIVEDNILNVEGFEKEELRSVGYLKLVEYINSYFQHKATYPLSSYLRTSIKDYLDTYQKAKILDDLRTKEIIEETFIEDFSRDIIEKTDLYETIKKSNLKERERKILEYVGMYSYTLEEVGQMYNITKSRTQQIYQRGIEKVLQANKTR